MADGQLNVDQRSSAEGHAAQKEAGIGAAAESAAEPDWRGELASFAQIYGLTPRETEICSYLVRGRSAKHIAEGARDFGKYGMEPCEERVCENGRSGQECAHRAVREKRAGRVTIPYAMGACCCADGASGERLS